MVALQIRDVPEDVRDTLAARAQERGQSLQAFLLALVLREAAFAQNLDLLEEIESWPGEGTAGVEDVLAERDAARAGRDEALGTGRDTTAEAAPGRPAGHRDRNGGAA